MWESARRVGMHKLVPITLALGGVMLLVASDKVQEVATGAEQDAQRDVLLAALAVFAVSALLFARSTLRGSYFEPDVGKRIGREARNFIGLMIGFAIGGMIAFFLSRTDLDAVQLATFISASGGGLLGAGAGVGGVWLLHHLRGTWPPDSDPDWVHKRS